MLFDEPFDGFKQKLGGSFEVKLVSIFSDVCVFETVEDEDEDEEDAREDTDIMLLSKRFVAVTVLDKLFGNDDDNGIGFD